MRIVFNTFLPIWPVVSGPPAKTPKARELVAHVLRDTRIGEQAQAARQARRAAAGLNGPLGAQLPNHGLSVGQTAAHGKAIPGIEDYLVDYLWPYLAASAPSTRVGITNLCEILTCPANERYNSKFQGINTKLGVFSYQVVEGSTAAGRGYCGLKWNPFGYSAASISPSQPPHKLGELLFPSRTWEMVDLDKTANPLIGSVDVIPEKPIQGALRNCLRFDGHVAIEKADMAYNSIGPYHYPYWGLNIN